MKIKVLFIYFLWYFFTSALFSQKEFNQKKSFQINSDPRNLVEFYGPLFTAIQQNHIFPDQKTFVDATPKSQPDSILHQYLKLKDLPDFNLQKFVLNNFAVTGRDTSDMLEHLNFLWNDLTRHSSNQNPYSTLISLPHKYIIPGGRFGEIFYWDSYFTMLGLDVSGRQDLIESMIRNFAYLIDVYGHVPNGSRTYFISRSQPPFFAMMVELLANSRQDKKILLEFLPEMLQEYNYWMSPERTIEVAKGEYLTQYWDALSTPRPEAWSHSEKFYAQSNRDSSYFRDERAACESGWDFSSRWFKDGKNMRSLNTLELVQVDLNSLLCKTEQIISEAEALCGNKTLSAEFKTKSEKRASLIRKYCWDPASGFFYDYNHAEKKLSPYMTLGAVYPLFLNIANKDQAAGVAKALKEKFLKPGGLVTTLINTGEQWDAPNGWAPLEWASYQGLKNYGYKELAKELAKRWTDLNIKVYIETGKMTEKYNVEDINKPGGGGEYAAQDGFGWTNGVFLKMWKELNSKDLNSENKICKQTKSVIPNLENTSVEKEKNWWKEAVIYQLYPRSFKDSNGDGIGDLRGVISKLDYLKDLGITAIWFNPFYESPNDDNGYDVSDYRNIMKQFGTMQDFDDLLQGMKERNIKMIVDLVVNHSSDEHPWFKSARSSRNSPYRNYYHWWPAEKGKPAYRYSHFDVKSDGWAYDSLTNSYYLHYFSKKQPDLNWENPKVRNEVYDIMKFWLDKGVDGFRMDAFQYVRKDTTFPAFPKGFEKEIIKWYGMRDGIHGYLQEMYNTVLSKYPGAMTVAEGSGSTFEDAHALVDADRKELDMAYQLEGVHVGDPKGYNLIKFKDMYSKWDSAFANSGWQSIFLANHDNPRMVSKFGNDKPEFRELSSKTLNTWVLAMRGTPYIYSGDEIGMTNIYMDNIKDYDDVAARNQYQNIIELGKDPAPFIEELKLYSRDNSRTPMQWDDSKLAGFSSGEKSWMKVNPNFKEINVKNELKNPNSILNYVKKMIEFRKDHPELIYGKYELLDRENQNIYSFTRSQNGKSYLILLNFSEKNSTAQTGLNFKNAVYQLGNYPDKPVNDNTGNFKLRPWESVIYEIF